MPLIRTTRSSAISRLHSGLFSTSSGAARRPPLFAKSSGELRRDRAEALAEAGSAFGAKAAAISAFNRRHETSNLRLSVFLENLKSEV